MDTIRFSRLLMLCVLVVNLCACGGGGGNTEKSPSPVPGNAAPTVSIISPGDMFAATQGKIQSSAQDSDGTIKTYEWVLESGSGISLTDTDKASVSFVADDVRTDTRVTLRLVVTDDRGTSTTAKVEFTIKRKISTVTITGVVTDEMIPAARVRVLIGDRVVEANADELGHYSIPIELAGDELDKVVSLEAIGDTRKPGVKFISVLNSGANLIIQAGADGQLSREENFDVNITNVTTAEYALMARADVDISTAENLHAAQLAIDAQQKLTLAALIKIVVDKPDYELPAEAQDTLELVQKVDVANSFKSYVDEREPQLVEQTITAIINDPQLVTVASDGLAGRYFMQANLYNSVVTPDANFPNNFVPSYDPLSSLYWVLDLNADGTGFVVNQDGSTAITWVASGNKVNLSFASSLMAFQGYIQDVANNGFAANLEITGAEFEIVDRSDFASTIRWTQKRQLVGTDDQVIYRKDQQMFYTSLGATSGSIQPVANDLTGTWLFNGMDSDESYVSELEFFADGNVISRETNGDQDEDSLSKWSVTQNHIAFSEVDGEPEHKASLYLTSQFSVGYNFVIVHEYAGDLFMEYGQLIKPQANVNFTKADLVGIWSYDGSDSYWVNYYTNDGLSYWGLGQPPNKYEQNTAGQWATDQYSQGSSWGLTTCNPYAISPCYQTSKERFNVIAVVGDEYWFLGHYSYSQNGEEYSKNSYVFSSKKLSGLSRFGDWILSDQHFFQSTSNGVNVWSFHNSNLLISDRVVIQTDQMVNPFSLIDGKLHYLRDDLAKVLELKSVADDGLHVCEYNEGSSCTAADEFVLGNRPPATMSLAVNGEGNVDYGYWPQGSTQTPYYQYGNQIGLIIAPKSGYVIGSVSGCDGELEANYYTTAAITSNCTVTVNFVPQP